MEKQENQAQFIYPIPFQDFLHSRKKQKEAVLSNFNAKQMSKLRKLKKLLEMTEEKICNRIKLFKKVSVEIRKRKQKQYNYQERIQNIKRKALPGDQVKNNWGHSYMRPTKSSAGLKRVRQISEAEKAEHSEKKTDVFLEEKLQQAQEIKMWKQKNKIIVEQRKLREMREKIQSANIIRSNRHKVKEIKMQWEQERLEEARKLREEKFQEQIEKYDELQQNLARLQKEERDALIMWKQAMESP